MTPVAAPLAALASVWVGSALWVHLRGRERLSFMRQVADHSTFLAPYNAFVYLFSAVPTRPVLRPDDLPELAHLEAHWEEIRDEARALLRSGDIRKPAKHDDLAFNSFYKRDWRRFYLKWYGDFMPSARALCPRTIELLAATPTVHAAMFAVLAPHSHLVRHRDPFAGSLRYHLGLQTPNDDTCRIFIDGVPYLWTDGQGMLFDETYIHRAETRTDAPRIILFCDVERPLRTPMMRALNRGIANYVLRVTASRNVPSEKIGLVNRVSGYVHQLRRVFRRAKKANRRLYYAVKASLYGLVIWELLLRRLFD